LELLTYALRLHRRFQVAGIKHWVAALLHAGRDFEDARLDFRSVRVGVGTTSIANSSGYRASVSRHNGNLNYSCARISSAAR
jgi:hypothetical protein